MPYKDKEAERRYRHKYYLDHRDEFLARASRWARANPEKLRESRKKWDSANSDKIKAYRGTKAYKEAQLNSSREYVRRGVKDLSDTYIRRVLRMKDCHRSLIEAKRIQLKIHRRLTGKE